jgi:hypothetical protein
LNEKVLNEKVLNEKVLNEKFLNEKVLNAKSVEACVSFMKKCVCRRLKTRFLHEKVFSVVINSQSYHYISLVLRSS